MRNLRPLTALCLLGAAVVVLVGIGLPLVGVRVFAGTDRLLAFAPWKASAPNTFTPTNICVGDTIDSVIPQHKVFDRELGDGVYASWNPFTSGGSPLASTPSPAVFSPPAWTYLFLPTWLAPAWAKLVEMVIAIGGMFLFLRRLTLSPPAAVLGGIVFATSGFMISWTNWPQTQVACFIPLLFWAVERFVQLRTPRAEVPIALVTAAMLLGGFPAVTGWAFYAAVPYFLLRMGWVHRRSAGRFLGGSVLAGAGLVGGVALVGAQLLPFLTQLNSTDLSYRAQESHVHLPLLSAITMLVPDAFGSCTNSAPAYWGPNNISEIELLSYVGGAALVLVLVGVLRRPSDRVPTGVRGFLVLAALVTGVLLFVGGPLLSLAQHLPVFSNNFVGRLRSMLGFFLAALAALGYDRLARPPDARRPRYAVLLEAAVWVAAAAVVAVAVRHVMDSAASVHHSSFLHSALWVPLVGLGVGAAAVAVSSVARGGVRAGALAVVPVVVVVQAMSVVLPFWPRVPRSQFYPVTDTHRFLAAHLGHERYANTGQTMEPGTNSWYGLRSATGHAFTETGWKDLLLTAAGAHAFPSPTYSTLPPDAGVDRLSSPILDLMAVKYVVRSPDDPPLGTVSDQGGSGAARSLAPGNSVDVPLPAAPLRGVGPFVAAPAEVVAPYAALHVDVVGADGAVLASGERRLPRSLPAGPFVVPVAGENLGAAGHGALHARLSLRRASAPLSLDAGADGVHARVVTGGADSLRLVRAGGGLVYERTTALPRFRWATRTEVVRDEKARLTLLANSRDPQRVVLSAPGPAASGRPATVHVDSDRPEREQVTVDAQGSGYLVVADALQGSSWRATVDGHAAPLRDADEGLVAVAVPAGRHVVVLHDSRSQMKKGLLITAFGLVLVAVLWFGGRARRRRRV